LEGNKKILIVDDEAPIRRVLEIKLKRQGYRVLIAKNGQEGLDAIQLQKPEVVISDINMPVMNGKILCEKTNELKQTHPFLTIVITARILPEDREWIKNLQDTLFLEKPFSPVELLELVDQYMGKY